MRATTAHSGRSRGGRTGVAIAAIFVILTVLAGTWLALPAFAMDTFPLCSPTERLQLYVTFNDAASVPGAFTLAGCTYPFGYAVKVWFKTGSNPGYGKPVPGLPSTSQPLVLQSRWMDGHFHKTLILPPEAPDRTLVTALLVSQYLASTGYTYDAEIIVGEPLFLEPEPETSYALKKATQRAAEGYSAWAPADAPSGTFTFFGTTGVSGAHVRLWFENATDGAALPGLYSRESPWTGALSGNRFRLSFVLPAGLPIDFARPNVVVKMLVLETGTVIETTIWIHRVV